MRLRLNVEIQLDVAFFKMSLKNEQPLRGRLNRPNFHHYLYIQYTIFKYSTTDLYLQRSLAYDYREVKDYIHVVILVDHRVPSPPVPCITQQFHTSD